MNVGLVLDPSALAAYARGSLAVGELLLIIGEEDRRAAVPVIALAEAYAVTDDADHVVLTYLGVATSTDVVPVDRAETATVGKLARRTTLGVAHAVMLATSLDTYLVTADAKAVHGLIEHELVIEV